MRKSRAGQIREVPMAGKLYQPQTQTERHATLSRITGLIRMGISTCVECQEKWDENFYVPLQANCGHVKCKVCFTMGSGDGGPCRQCEASAARKVLRRKRKADYEYEEDKIQAPVQRKRVEEVQTIQAPVQRKRVEEVQTIQAPVQRKRVEEVQIIQAPVQLKRVEEVQIIQAPVQENTDAEVPGKPRGEFRFVNVQDILSGKFSSDNFRENENKEEVQKSSLTEAVPTHQSIHAECTSTVELEKLRIANPGKKSTTSLLAKKHSPRKLPVLEESQARKISTTSTNNLPKGPRFPNAKSKILPVYDRALLVTENDKKTATLFQKNQKEMPPPPPMPVRDVEAKPFKCSTCPAEFSMERELNLHEAFHLACTGPLFSCDICNEGFWKKIRLIHHYKREHGQDVNVSKIKENKLDVQKYLQLIKEKSVTATSAGPTEGNSSNDATSTSVKTAADNTVDVEEPRVENHAQTQCSNDDDVMILQINCMLPNHSAHAKLPKSEAHDLNANTRYTLSYEGDGITSVVFLENSNNNNNLSALF